MEFIGDYAQLKKHGFKFKRLYAMNYMQWERDSVRVWKSGNRITIDEMSGLGEIMSQQLVEWVISNRRILSEGEFSVHVHLLSGYITSISTVANTSAVHPEHWQAITLPKLTATTILEMYDNRWLLLS